MLSYFIIFVLGTFLGGTFQSYSLLYQQRLKSQLDQVRIDLEPFQKIADEFHRGSLTALIEHHLRSADPTFHAEGGAIRVMLESKDELVTANAALGASPLYQAIYFVKNIDYETARSTWRVFTPSIATTPEALRFSLAVGAGLSLLAYMAWGFVRLASRRLYGAVYRR